MSDSTFEHEYVKQGASKTIRRKEVAKIDYNHQVLDPQCTVAQRAVSTCVAASKCIPVDLVKPQENNMFLNRDGQMQE
jgi:hypothetical protein